MSDGQPAERRRNPWTHVLVATCAVFIFTVFLMVAAAFNQQATRLARFFDEHGMLVLGLEVGAILFLAVIVMSTERKETLQRLAERERALLDDAKRSAMSRETATREESSSGAEHTS